MSTDRIPWSRLDNDEFQHTIAMLICADNPLGHEYTPGPDGGVDIFVPDGPSSRKVYQVKNFPTKFDNSEFRQVKKSLTSVAATAKRDEWTISEWHLVTPRNSSPAYWTRIDALVTTHSIPTWSWIGLTQIDILAAGHPELIDYYLNGGKDRLTDQLADLTAIIRGDSTPSSENRLQPTDIGERILTLQRAANSDPHYRYHFETSDRPPQPTNQPDPWLVAVASEQHGPIWIHIKVYAKFLAALTERPIQTTLRINTEGNPELAENFQQFLDFGTDVHIPSGSAQVTTDLPGNLGRTLEAAEVHITAITTEPDGAEPAPALIAGARDATGNIVAETLLYRTEFTSGPRGGLRTVWTDTSRLFTLELRTILDPLDITANFTMNWHVDGRRPSDIAQSLTLMDALDRGATLGISPDHGPRSFSFTTAGHPADPSPDLHLTARLATALNIIQHHCTALLRMPSELTATELQHIFDAATLVQGQTITATWKPFTFTLDATHDTTLTPGSRINAAVITPLTITLGATKHELGQVASFIDATVTAIEDSTVFLKPADAHARSTRVLAKTQAHRVWVAQPLPDTPSGTDSKAPDNTSPTQ